MATIWTIGHSTRSFEELVDVLRHYGIRALVDVRTVPRSRTNPQFNKDEMEVKLPEEGIHYVHAKHLGGLRKPSKDSKNMGWENESFRGFADYMQTESFSEALGRLIELAKEKPTVIMCAEMVPWRCHRSLIADALLARAHDVVEIYDERKFQRHRMTPFAKVHETAVSYPATGDEALTGKLFDC